VNNIVRSINPGLTSVSAEGSASADPVIVTTESQLEKLLEKAVRRVLQNVDLTVPDGDDLTDMDGILGLAGPTFDKQWMYRHAVKLGFGIKVSHRKLLFSKRKFFAYLNGRYRTKTFGGPR
jgi:hypothetical protein